MLYKKIVLALVLMTGVQQSFAVGCSEKILTVEVTKDGVVNFTTDKTCMSNRCELSNYSLNSYWDTDDEINRGFTLLLNAKTSGAHVSFDWPSIAS